VVKSSPGHSPSPAGTVMIAEAFVDDLSRLINAVDTEDKAQREIFQGPLPDTPDAKYFSMESICKRLANCADYDDLKMELSNLCASFYSLADGRVQWHRESLESLMRKYEGVITQMTEPED
jgi:hypothetical protein